jgi:hypothetical protein
LLRAPCYSWSKEFLEAGTRRLASDTARDGHCLCNIFSSVLACFIDVTADRPVDFVKHLVPEEMIRPPVFGPSNFGLIDSDMTHETPETPELNFRVVDEHARSLCNPVSLAASELVNQASSWAENT